mgnify:CR=1 FL=1
MANIGMSVSDTWGDSPPDMTVFDSGGDSPLDTSTQDTAGDSPLDTFILAVASTGVARKHTAGRDRAGRR